MHLLEKAKREIASNLQRISGEVSIGGRPTATILKAAASLRKEHGDIQFHFFSGDATAVLEQLDHGSLDFAILLPPVDIQKYEFLILPDAFQWGLLMDRNSPLAEIQGITREILSSVPLVVSQRAGLQQEIARWAETELEQLNIAASYNVVYGEYVPFAKSGLGYVLTPRDHFSPDLDSSCCFRPLDPPLQLQYALVWKRYSVFSRAAEAFLKKMKLLLE